MKKRNPIAKALRVVGRQRVVPDKREALKAKADRTILHNPVIDTQDHA